MAHRVNRLRLDPLLCQERAHRFEHDPGIVFVVAVYQVRFREGRRPVRHRQRMFTDRPLCSSR